MPRFLDRWVVDRTLFEYVNGGSCSCCSGALMFFPGGVAGMIRDVSDLETDAADREIAALSNSPWPPDVREQVWADRVRLRQKMKREMPSYRKFFQDMKRLDREHRGRQHRKRQDPTDDKDEERKKQSTNTTTTNNNNTNTSTTTTTETVVTSPRPSPRPPPSSSSEMPPSAASSSSSSSLTSTSSSSFVSFESWLAGLDPKTLRRTFQMPRSEVLNVLNRTYEIHSAFARVVESVVEQVAHFDVTGYPPDAPPVVASKLEEERRAGGGGGGEGGESSSDSESEHPDPEGPRSYSSEYEFERILRYDRRGGFTLPVVAVPPTNASSSAGARTSTAAGEKVLDRRVLDVWIRRMKSLGGPKLLDRAPSKNASKNKNKRNQDGSDDDDDDDDKDDEDDIDKAEEVEHHAPHQRTVDDDVGDDGPSFRMDRRMVRLMIARYWADHLMKKYHDFRRQMEQEQQQQQEEEKKKQKGDDDNDNNITDNKS